MLRASLTRQPRLHWPVRQRIHKCYARQAREAPVEAPRQLPAEVVEAPEVSFAPPQYPGHVYQAAPQPFVPPPVAPAPAVAQSSGGVPFWVWLIVGALLHWVYSKVQEFRKNPMGTLMGFMKPSAPGAGAASGAGGDPMAAMFAQMQQQAAQQGNPGMGGNSFAAAKSTPTYNTTASDVLPKPDYSRNGSKFEDNKRNSTTSTPEASSSPPKPAAASAAPQAAFFSDAAPGPTDFFTDTSAQAPPSQASAADANNDEMVENMLLMVADNEELQKNIGQHLPPHMNNAAMWKWIKENPDIRKQMAKQISPAMAAQFGEGNTIMDNMPPQNQSSEEMMNQMKSMGVDPNEMMTKVMGDPEVLELMQKPHVTKALFEMQSNPSKAPEYMSDPDIFKLMQKMMAINPQLANMPTPPK